MERTISGMMGKGSDSHKIECSKQEKLFHEVILQIGNKNDMNARSENGQLAKKILIDFMEDFQQRNPHLLEQAELSEIVSR